LRYHLQFSAVLFMAAGLTQAAPITLSGLLSGANEVPNTGSPGTGVATVTLDPLTHLLIVDTVFSNLLSVTSAGLPSGTTAAHIHCCVVPPGNAGVATTVPTFAGFPLGVTSGTYHQTLDLLSTSSYNPAFITANGGTVASADTALEAGLLNGRTYLNIHTTAFPGGEVRAFLMPEPATGLLSLTALAGLWLIRRKNRLSSGR
jgi:hypothetical protein